MPQETKKTLIESIGEIQSDITIFVNKNARNDFNKYNYFSESDLYKVLKPKLKEHKITYTIESIGEPTFINNTVKSKDGEKIVITYYSKGLLTLYKENEKIELGITLSAQNNDMAKAVGSALTYGARYWLCKTFGIATDELDPDSTEISKENSNEVNKEIISNLNPNWMSDQHYNNIKDFITNKTIKQDIILRGKTWLKEELNVEKLSPVIIRRQNEDFYNKFKERFLR
ncbi:putative prophage recombination protein [Spiroplasma kunkelii CR2-3x]|uniref:Putative prophage recombination protein n=1 Tax=Spiroplasma kunkelii CR2-3x TaxID=273035 RepID=A0A0K2JEF1_SPIKU|nr:ERF family protein [Spiroplasma kunkelii]ALA96959.1 putative prophage recombination protein [Spiroplasma kunkelii CR2-3x]